MVLEEVIKAELASSRPCANIPKKSLFSSVYQPFLHHVSQGELPNFGLEGAVSGNSI